MKIEVKDEDITKGERGKCSSCPVALAIKRIAKIACEIYPSWRGIGMVYIDVNAHNSLKVPLPMFVNKQILAYDFGSIMEPFEFELLINKKEN